MEALSAFSALVAKVRANQEKEARETPRPGEGNMNGCALIWTLRCSKIVQKYVLYFVNLPDYILVGIPEASIIAALK